jgi:hypothetical protein
MFSKILPSLAMVAILLLLSCSAKEEFPEKYKGEQIHFGQGGGFTGELTYFALLDDGRLFKRSLRDSTFSLIDTWNSPFVAQMFTNYNSLSLDQIQFYEPGDLYYFIQHKSGDSPFHSITWGRPGTRPDQNIVTYYNLLYKSTKSKT